MKQNKLYRVYVEASKDLLERNPGLLALLKENFGEYIIEGEIPGRNYVISISFFTDKFTFIEGEDRRVDIVITETKEGVKLEMKKR